MCQASVSFKVQCERLKKKKKKKKENFNIESGELTVYTTIQNKCQYVRILDEYQCIIHNFVW